MNKNSITIATVSIFICLSITSHIIAYKILIFGEIEIIPSSLTYMACFVIMNAMATIHSKDVIKLLIAMEAIANILMIAILEFVTFWPSPDYVLNAKHYEYVFNPVITMYIANIIGSVVAFVVDYKIFSRLYGKFGFLKSSIISSLLTITVYTIITDILAFKYIYNEEYISLTITNVITNILFILTITISISPIVTKIKKDYIVAIKSLGHLNIVVDNIESASKYYSALLNASPQQRFDNFKNSGFSQSAGFIDNFNEVSVSIEFLKIDESDIYIELMQYHNPKSDTKINENKKTTDIGNIGHICLKVSDIDYEFSRIKSHDVKMITDSHKYKPFKISKISKDQFYLFDETSNNDVSIKEEIVNIISNIRYFYFIDKYGIQWEFEEGHADIGS